MKFISPSQVIQMAIADAISSEFPIFLAPQEISINICYPKYDSHYTSPISLAISKRLGIDALHIAESICKVCSQNLEMSSEWKVQAFGKGWLNISLSDKYIFTNLLALEHWQPDGIVYCEGFWQRKNIMVNQLYVSPEPMMQYVYTRCCALIRMAYREDLLSLQYIRDSMVFFKTKRDLRRSAPQISFGFEKNYITEILEWIEPIEISLFLQNLAIAEFLDLENQNQEVLDTSQVRSIRSKLEKTLATVFLEFYDRCRIFGVNREIVTRRLLLIKITQKIILAIARPEIEYAMYL